jgi:hypothetical protein
MKAEDMRPGVQVRLVDGNAAGIPESQCPNGSILTLESIGDCGIWRTEDKNHKIWYVNPERVEPLEAESGK